MKFDKYSPGAVYVFVVQLSGGISAALSTRVEAVMRTGSDRAADDRERGEGRHVGDAAELPSGAVVDAQAGAHLRGTEPRQDTSRLPPLAHQLPVQDVPGRHPPEQRQDDQRTAERSVTRAGFKEGGGQRGPRQVDHTRLPSVV